MIWVTVEDVIAVHSRIIKASGGLDGIREIVWKPQSMLRCKPLPVLIFLKRTLRK